MAKTKKHSIASPELGIAGVFPAELKSIAASLDKVYTFEGEIAAGKTGMTYKIRSRVNSHFYCLKTILSTITDKERRAAVSKTLEKEVEILGPLNHRCLPRVYERHFGVDSSYYVCSYQAGKTFEVVRKQGRILSLNESTFVVSQLFSAFKYLHGNGRTHCDLHGKNILMADDVLAHGILIVDLGSGHRDSDGSPETVDRGNMLFKGIDGMPSAGGQVNRAEMRDAFAESDYSAVGVLLGSMASVFFSCGSIAQRQAYLAMCEKLAQKQITSWDAAEAAFLAVLDPFRALSELAPLFQSVDGIPQSIVLPVSRNVPVGSRSLRVINSQSFQRLRGIKQLSFCDWFFPGATHTRFEHSLGAFALAKRAAESLMQDKEVRGAVDADDLKALLLAGLLHDVGHYPFAHVLEQYAATRVPDAVEAKNAVSHSAFSVEILRTDDELREAIGKEWGEAVLAQAMRLMAKSNNPPIMYDLMDGAIDLDKMDYLRRDAYHCGVSFGSGLDVDRLLGALCLVGNSKAIGIKDYAVPIVEGFLILQHQMLSSVYWQEQVRGVICMFHGVLADIVGKDVKTIAAFADGLKRCKSDAEGVAELNKWIDERGGARKRALQNLIAPHTTFDFNAIYSPIKRYAQHDAIKKGKFLNIHQSILEAPSSQISGMPVEWGTVKSLHLAYCNAFREVVSDLDEAEIVVDVPYGKGSHRSVIVKDEVSGVERDIISLSHLNKTVFEKPAAFDSPIRVYLSPRVLAASRRRSEALIGMAEEEFYGRGASVSADGDGR